MGINLKLENNANLKQLIECSYIKSNNDAYINTGVTADTDVAIEMSFEFVSLGGDVFGTSTSSSNANPFTFECYVQSSGHYLFRYPGMPSSSWVLSTGVKYNVEFKSGKQTIYDTVAETYKVNTNNVFSSIGQNNNPIYLFGRNSNNGITAKSALILYYCKIYKSNVLIRDYVPYNVNGTYCLYDKVSDTYYYNQGTNGFTGGTTDQNANNSFLSKITSLYVKNCPNYNIEFLRNIVASQKSTETKLTRILMNIGNVSGPIQELLTYSTLAGFNDDYENQTKPKLIGTWTVNSWYLGDKLAEVQAAFDGLTVQGDGTHLIDFNNNIAVQTLDPTQPNYNPAAAIRLHSLGYGHVVNLEGCDGSYILTVQEAAAIPSTAYFFRQITKLQDTQGIVSSDTSKYYFFKSFDEFRYFTGFTSTGMYSFESCYSLESIILPNTIVTITNSSFSSCARLKTINIPISTYTIESNAFYNCFNLTDISYSGNIGQWCSIIFGNEASNPLQYSHKLILENQEVTGNIEIPNTVHGALNYTFIGCESITEVTIPNTITSLTGTFKGCSGITSIVIPSSVSLLGSSVFHNCTSLSNITIPSSITSFGNYLFSNTGFTTFTCSNNITSLGGWCFSDCKNLENVILSSNLLTIGESAFQYSAKMTHIDIPSSVTSIGNNAFVSTSLDSYTYTGTLSQWCKIYFGNQYSNPAFFTRALVASDIDSNFNGEVTIPQEVTSIRYQFTGALNVKSIVFHNGITRIENYAFYGGGIENITIPNSVTYLGSYAFQDSKVKNITLGTGVVSIPEAFCNRASDLNTCIIPSGYLSIGVNAFRESSLTAIDIPSTVTSIGDNAFMSCASLTSVTLNSGLKTISANAFSSSLSSGLEVVYIPSTVTSIGSNAFSNVRHLVYTGSATGAPWGSLTSINGYEDGDLFYTDSTKTKVLSGKANIVNLVIPSGVTHIQDKAFSKAVTINTVQFPNTLTNIGSQAFNNCYRMFNVVVPSNVTSCGTNAFGAVQHIQISSPLSGAYGARYVNKYVEGHYIYNDSTKTSLLFVDPILSTFEIAASVTSLGTYCFAFNENITSVTIPNRVTSLGNSCFYNCKNLTSIDIPVSMRYIGSSTFLGCTNLGTYNYQGTIDAWLAIDFNDSAANPSYYNRKLLIGGSEVTSVTIPSNITSIAKGTFANCSNVTSVTLNNTITSIGQYAFSGTSITDLNIPSSVTSIGGHAFRESRIENVTIPESVVSMGETCFYNCKNLNNVVINAFITTLPASTFSGAKMRNFTINNNITSLGGSAFAGATIDTLYIPSSVTSLGGSCFYNAKINNYIYNGTVQEFFNITCAANSAILPSAKKLLIGGNSITNLNLPSNMTTFKANNTLYYAQNIEYVTFPEVFATLLDNSLMYASNLKEVTIPTAVTTIPTNCFLGCTSLHKVVLGDRITSINNQGFRDCSKLLDIYITAPTPPTLGTSAFLYVPTYAYVHVPENSVDTYKSAAGWSAFSNYIIPIEEE